MYCQTIASQSVKCSSNLFRCIGIYLRYITTLHFILIILIFTYTASIVSCFALLSPNPSKMNGFSILTSIYNDYKRLIFNCFVFFFVFFLVFCYIFHFALSIFVLRIYVEWKYGIFENFK